VIRTAGVYLLFAAVVTLRALVVFAGDPQLALVMALLATYGLLLFCLAPGSSGIERPSYHHQANYQRPVISRHGARPPFHLSTCSCNPAW
jgi:hypothetical protein